MPTPTTTDIQISTDTSFNTLSINENINYTTTRTFTPGELPYGVNLYMRIKHHADDANMDTPWSDVRSFKVQAPAEIIGVCMDNSDTTKAPVWDWIDADGNKVDTFDYISFPVSKNTESIPLSNMPTGSSFSLKIPRVYVKTAVSGPINTFAAGKKCWWISNTPTDGFYIHPAFCRNDDNGYTTNVCEYEYVQGESPQTMSGGFPSDLDNFRLFDIYDFGLMMLLSTIANKGPSAKVKLNDDDMKFFFVNDYIGGIFLNGKTPMTLDTVYMVNPVKECTNALGAIIFSKIGGNELEYTDDLRKNESVVKCLIPGLKDNTGFGPVRLWGGPSTNPAQYLPDAFPLYSRDFVSGSILFGYKDGNASTDSLTCDSMCLFIPKLSEINPAADLSFAYYSKESCTYRVVVVDPMDPLPDPGNNGGPRGPNWLFRCYGGTPLNMVIRPFVCQSYPTPEFNFSGKSTNTMRYCKY